MAAFSSEALRRSERVALYRKNDPDFAHWAAGYGVIEHTEETQLRLIEMVELLAHRKQIPSTAHAWRALAAADRLNHAGLWLVVHMTYARKVWLDGRDLTVEDFKPEPEGHTGGSLNMVPAYLGYLLANHLTGTTRAWMMGQGHCVAAIDALNLLVDNLSPAHAERYALTDEGLTRFANDFYSYKLNAGGKIDSPLGSHVNPHTAGGLIEGGYLGFAELYYPHMTLPGERLVAFLSDGAFEEQRGSDWAPRWWRSEDSGYSMPIMIANGRRIDQRTTMSQSGGVEWLREHLRHNNFDPIDIDGRDPAAFAWAILEMEERLAVTERARIQGQAEYPCLLPYTIAEAPKGFGFFGEGTNFAHNLPLGSNPAKNPEAASAFHRSARRLWLPLSIIQGAVQTISQHESQGRKRERDHALMERDVKLPSLPAKLPYRVPSDTPLSPMEGLDDAFCALLKQNPSLRPRLGNPDELSSNRMNKTLHLLKHRVTDPEASTAEDIHGAIITALNEEAVICAALANKGGINLAVTYEAFGVKMLGAIRQELIFTRHQHEIGQDPRWLSVPVILTSHTWENGKNEQSHQDPTLAEALLSEMSDLSRVVFPADWNTAIASILATYQTHAQIWTKVIPKRPVPQVFSTTDAQKLVAQGAFRLRGDASAPLLLVAVGAYQLTEVLRASDRLRQHAIEHAVIYLYEPARFRSPRDPHERVILASDELKRDLFPDHALHRIFVSHTRPEALLGALRPLDTGAKYTHALGYLNRGGTLDAEGMLFVNRSTWAHIVEQVATAQEIPLESLLLPDEINALHGQIPPLHALYPHRS
jgi:phosphoketolase